MAINVCRNLARKVIEHKRENNDSKKEKKLSKLLYYEMHSKHENAMERDKVMRYWDENYLKQVIALQNSKFMDLTDKLFSQLDMFDSDGSLIR